ncbi:MAG TPA: DUF99 family protein [Polyangiaceae bacterium]
MNVIGFDDGPFAREHRGNVLLVGAVCSRTRLDGVLTGRVRRDGTDATDAMVTMVENSQFAEAVRAVMLQGIAVGGFNVVDVHGLSVRLGVPVLVVMRHAPDMAAVRRALFSDAPTVRPPVRGAARKWRLIESAGPIEPLGKVHVQRVDLTMEAARKLVTATTLHGNIPEPLRLAHLIAGGLTTGRSRGRA